MTDQLPEKQLLKCCCAEVKNQSAIANVVFGGKSVWFAPKMCGCIDCKSKVKEYIIE